MPIFRWLIKDARGNTVTVTAPSAAKAKRQFTRMLRGSKIISVTRTEEVKAPEPTLVDKALKRDVRKVEPIRRMETKVRPNDPCPCWSGRKFKKCCGKKARSG